MTGVRNSNAAGSIGDAEKRAASLGESKGSAPPEKSAPAQNVPPAPVRMATSRSARSKTIAANRSSFAGADEFKN